MPIFLDVELVPEYLRPDVNTANALLASYNEISELLTENMADIPLDQFTRLLAQQKLAFESYLKRSSAIIEHMNHESAIIAERLGLTD